MSSVQKFCEELFIVDGADKIRIGQEKDGGYVCDQASVLASTELFSFGVGDDISFEKAFLAHNPNLSNIHLFDHTVDGLPEGAPESFHFHKKAFDPDTLSRLGTLVVPGAKRTLKMDVEWSEWEAFYNTPSDILDEFQQIVCEFHIVPINFVRVSETPYFTGFFESTYAKLNDHLFEMYAVVMKHLRKTHSIVHLHANNSLPCIELDGYRIPQLLEATLVRNDLIQATPFRGTLPIPGLDFPNKPWKPEIENFYPFVRNAL